MDFRERVPYVHFVAIMGLFCGQTEAHKNSVLQMGVGSLVCLAVVVPIREVSVWPIMNLCRNLVKAI